MQEAEETLIALGKSHQECSLTSLVQLHIYPVSYGRALGSLSDPLPVKQERKK